VTGNQSQWPAQYPGDNPPDDAQEPLAPPSAPPTGYQPPPTSYQAPAAQPATRPNGHPAAPASYPAPPSGYPVLPGSYGPQPGSSGPGSYGPQPANYGPGHYSMQPGRYEPGPHASMRAASADRERTVDVLKAGFAEGRLTQEEYNERMGRAYSARTYGELIALTSDLPAGPLPTAWPVPAYQAPPPVATTNSMAVASMVLGVAELFTAGLTAVPAVICGHVARRQVKLTGQRGDGLATSGLVLGYMAIIFWAVLIAASLVSVAITVAHNGGSGAGSFPGP
jgi:uncharacterized membrane protein